MSYILDALRKAERERRVSPVPTLDAAHEGPAPARRPAWPWALTGALAVSAVAMYGLWGFWASGPPDTLRHALAPASTVAGLESPAKTAPPPASPQVSLSSARADQAPGQVPVAPARGPAPEPIAPPNGVAPAPAPPRALDAPSAADGARAGLPRDGRAEGTETRAPAMGSASSPLSGTPSESAIGQRPAPPAPTAPAVPAAPPAPAPPPAVALAPTPSPAAAPGRAAPTDPADPLALTLDVLVYSELPAERLVFINGRKYLEGQAVTGDVVVEQITPDGAILRRADQRIVLRPKLNPYARPGSP